MNAWEKQAQPLLETTTLSYKQIGERVGRSRDSVVKFCHEQKIKRPTNKLRGHPKWADIPKLSPEHVALGLKVTLYRNNIAVSEMASRIGISSYVLRMIEYGLYDVTLSQLVKLSIIMGQTVTQLIETHHD